MNDLERTKEFFKSLNIECEITKRQDQERGPFGEYAKLSIGEGVGYGGFCTEFYFDEDGKFINYGVWE